MKKGFFKPACVLALILTMGLGAFGCGSKIVKPQPPVGCEDSILWKMGFMPLGPDVVALSVKAAVTYAPKTRAAMLKGAYRAQEFLDQEGLKAGINHFAMVLIDEVVKDPNLNPLVAGGLEMLYKVIVIPDRLLLDYDKQIIQEMVRQVIDILEGPVAKRPLPGVIIPAEWIDDCPVVNDYKAGDNVELGLEVDDIPTVGDYEAGDIVELGPEVDDMMRGI